MEFLWQEARVQFLGQLSGRQQAQEEARREHTTLEDTVKSLSQAKDKADQAYGTKFHGKPVEVKLSRVLHRLDIILSIGDDAMKFAPAGASYVWATFRLVASGIAQDFETCQFLVDAVDQISEILLLCEVYAKRQLRQLRNLTHDSQLLADKTLEKIPPLLALVLRFSHVTRRLALDKGRFGRTFSIMFGGAEKLKAIFKEAEAKRDELNRMAGLAFNEALREILQDAQLDAAAIRKTLSDLDSSNRELLRMIKGMGQFGEEITSVVKEIKLEQSKEREAAEKKLLDEEFHDQMRWLRSEGLADLHEPRKMLYDNLARRHPSTCEWAIQNEHIKAWLESASPAPSARVKRLLWLSGEAGFGKSVLMSYLIGHLERQRKGPRPRDGPVVLPFFCKLGNDAFQKGSKIFAHLLCQLFHLSGVEEASDKSDKTALYTKQRCVELVRRLRLETRSNEPTINSARVSIFCDLVKAFGQRVYVCIDALDECEDRTNGLLSTLVQIAETNMDVRVLVSSRPEPDISKAFMAHGPSQIEVQKSITEKDVAVYIAASLQGINRFDQSKRKKAAVEIAKKAGGMFRCEYSWLLRIKIERKELTRLVLSRRQLGG